MWSSGSLLFFLKPTLLLCSFLFLLLADLFSLSQFLELPWCESLRPEGASVYASLRVGQ